MTASNEIPADWGTIRYLSHGEGPNVALFLHGGEANASSWRSTLAGLRSGWLGLAPDLFASDSGPEGATVGYFALLGLELLRSSEVRRVVIVGHSLGGVAALEVALAKPPGLAGLILSGTGASVEGHGTMPNAIDRLRREGTSLDFGSDLARRLSRRAAADPELSRKLGHSFAALPSDRVVSAWESLLRVDLISRLGEISVPTLVVRGERDVSRTTLHVRQLLRGLERARAVEVPDSGHSVPLDSPETWQRLVNDFLEEVEG